MGSGKLCVMMHGTSMKLRWSVGSWDMGVQYQHLGKLILGEDLVVSGMCTGTAVGVKQVYKAALLVLQVAVTVKMLQSGALVILVSHTMKWCGMLSFINCRNEWSGEFT